MARLHDEHEESDDEFPDISTIISRFYQNKLSKPPSETRSHAEEHVGTSAEEPQTPRYGGHTNPIIDPTSPALRPCTLAEAPNADSSSNFDNGLIAEAYTSPGSPSEDELFAVLRFSPSESKIAKDSPSKQSCVPPSTRLDRTPTWDQEIVNEQGDRRKRVTAKRVRQRKVQPTAESDVEQSVQPRTPGRVKQNRSNLSTKKAFNERKHDLAQDFLNELDEKVSGGQIASITAPTGVKLIWSKKLTTTAGRANWRKEKITQFTADESLRGTGGPSTSYRHIASIELSEKVIDDEDRLLNALSHEYCHLANFMISGVLDHPHGESFKKWAKICTRAFGHRGVEVTTKHSYAIDYKYIWECTSCGAQFKRHSKSVDPARHSCGSCKSSLVQIQPTPRNTALSEYQRFVRENFKEVKRAHPLSPQKEIMSLLGAEYKRERRTAAAVVETAVSPGRGGSEGDLDSITGALEDLDLRSP
ncbi:hypothetical protein GP486_000961 [Trichoglossum hirsutum]|uniref:SprT-like domain-containing protein n=1 Tax=Trichoglossum hirsutum TaxID=265104 RepID=A0A9P8RT59_9PEZI|nr:hypothetical protein GP486_000961 [Trichoglossum hirsutum]